MFDYRIDLTPRQGASGGDAGKVPEKPVFLQCNRRTMPYFYLPEHAEGSNRPIRKFVDVVILIRSLFGNASFAVVCSGTRAIERTAPNAKRIVCLSEYDWQYPPAKNC